MTSSEDYWSQVPAKDEATGETTVSVLGVKPSRRTLLGTAGALGGALALNIVGALPPARPRKASADPGTEHVTCSGYEDWTGYSDDMWYCVGAENGSVYCGGDGWFFHGSWDPDTYLYPISICGDDAYDKLNAWRWQHRGAEVMRCADGNIKYGDGSTIFRICSWQVG